jgi:hypothetical protein
VGSFESFFNTELRWRGVIHLPTIEPTRPTGRTRTREFSCVRVGNSELP